MHVLFLNDMRSAQYETLEPVARAETREALEAFLEREGCETYCDDGTRQVVHHSDFTAQLAGGVVIDQPRAYAWRKNYRQGGPLE